MKRYFDNLNRLSVGHQCDGRTDGRTDRQREWHLAIAPYNDARFKLGKVTIIRFISACKSPVTLVIVGVEFFYLFLPSITLHIIFFSQISATCSQSWVNQIVLNLGKTYSNHRRLISLSILQMCRCNSKQRQNKDYACQKHVKILDFLIPCVIYEWMSNAFFEFSLWPNISYTCGGGGALRELEIRCL